MKETDIVNSICEYLSYKKDLMFWRNNTLPVFSKQNNSFIRMPKWSKTGGPDICVIKDGFFVGLEVKQIKGRQSPNQKQWEQECKDAGGEYHVVKSIDDVKEIGL